jgi:phosphate/sulfate permease
METFYLVLVIILFILAISDLVVGVSNDAVNFLNSALGAKAASFKVIMLVAALGVLAGATFSSGMMEVARKGIFHPEYFYFSEIIILFLAVMVTDVILLDTFNTFGMPTSTTVSIVFELLGAAVALSLIKIWTNTDALELWEYINSAKALAIISGILLSVVVAFSAGVLAQYLSRLLFSFDYSKRMKWFGGLWGGVAIAAITFFILVKGAKGASFMSSDLKSMIKENSMQILLLSFVAWAIILQILNMFTKFNMLKFIVLIGTFALAMAFSGNDLVNFIGVPLAGFNSYQMWVESGMEGSNFLMDGLAGKVPTPTLLLLLAGLIMVITLYTSKKARSVVKTSLDLGRQDEGSERFSSYYVSRALVRNFSNFATFINKKMPKSAGNAVKRQFDETPFIKKTEHMGAEAPAFDMLRASVTLVVAAILISIGTSLKLPLSTTYVTFMVFMGTSLADGAWGRESAVFRVSGVISVIGGWFFTAFSAFTAAFILAMIFYYGGIIGIVIMLCVAGYTMYRTHAVHKKRTVDDISFEEKLKDEYLTKEKIVDYGTENVVDILTSLDNTLDKTIRGLGNEDLNLLTKTKSEFVVTLVKAEKLKNRLSYAMDRIANIDLEAGHFYALVVDYLREMTRSVRHIIDPALSHVDNHHKPLLPEQIEEMRNIKNELQNHMRKTIEVFQNKDAAGADELFKKLNDYVKTFRKYRKNQIKRIRAKSVGTRNSILYYHLIGEFRNLALFSNRLVKVYDDLMLDDDDED